MTVNTTIYEFNHGQKPRGFGAWVFRVGQNDLMFKGKFSDVVKIAKFWARQIGATQITVQP